MIQENGCKFLYKIAFLMLQVETTKVGRKIYLAVNSWNTAANCCHQRRYIIFGCHANDYVIVKTLPRDRQVT